MSVHSPDGGVKGARVTFLTPAPTEATAAAAFPADEPLDERGRAWAGEVSGVADRATRAGRVCCAPERAARETAALLGLAAVADAGLAEWDLGRWRGRGLADVARDEPAEVAAWLADPAVAPHGGEPLAALLDRAGAWLARVPPGHTVAVCGGAVVRAAVVTVLGAPAGAFWRVDLAPLTRTDLRGGPDRWTVRATGAPLRRSR